jgi:hypothetical protein
MTYSWRCRGSVAVLTLLASLTVTANSSATELPASHFRNPTALAIDQHGNLWVTNEDRYGITEVDAATGNVIRRIDSKEDGFDNPVGITVDGNHVWMINIGFQYRITGQDSVDTLTELDATTGALLSWTDLKSRGIEKLRAITSDGNQVWVYASGGTKMIEISNATGQIHHVYRGPFPGSVENEHVNIVASSSALWLPRPATSGVVAIALSNGARLHSVTPTRSERQPNVAYKVPFFLGPDLFALSGGHLWTINQGGLKFKARGSLTEIDPATGRIVHYFGSKEYDFSSNETAVYANAHDVWFANGTVGTSQGMIGNTITEFSGENGAVVHVIHLHDGGVFSDPTGIVSNGPDLFVTNEVSNVVEIDAATGVVIRTIR